MVPNTVLLGASEIFIQRPEAGSLKDKQGEYLPSTQFLTSTAVTIDNKAGYAFAGDSTGVQVIDRALPFEDEEEADELIHRIELGATVNEIVVTSDLGTAFVATTKGVAVIDTLSLRQFDINPETTKVDMIEVPGNVVTALAVEFRKQDSLHRRRWQAVHRQH